MGGREQNLNNNRLRKFTELKTVGGWESHREKLMLFLFSPWASKRREQPPEEDTEQRTPSNVCCPLKLSQDNACYPEVLALQI